RCRSAGQSAGDSVVDAGGGAAGLARYGTGSVAAWCRWLGLAVVGRLLRSELAAVFMVVRQLLRAVVVAGGRAVCIAAGAGRGVVAVAAPRRTRQGDGAAAVAGPVVAVPRAAGRRRVRAAGVRCRA